MAADYPDFPGRKLEIESHELANALIGQIPLGRFPDREPESIWRNLLI